MTTAVGQLKAIAQFDGERRSVHTRVAYVDRCGWLDLCNDRWQSVEVTAAGWRVVDEPAVRFTRASGTKPLPVPAAGLANLDSLFDLLHFDDADLRLLVTAWLVNSVMNVASYPILALTGEQGSGKTTLCRALQRLIDPHAMEGRSPPRSEEDIAVAAQHAHLLVYENLSGISTQLSDSLCRVATGAGFAARKLYTDADERQLSFCRPIIINGINDLATRSDLADRMITVHLQPIAGSRRRTEADLWARFDELQPRLLGAVLHLVAKVLGAGPVDVSLERMAEDLAHRREGGDGARPRTGRLRRCLPREPRPRLSDRAGVERGRTGDPADRPHRTVQGVDRRPARRAPGEVVDARATAPGLACFATRTRR